MAHLHIAQLFGCSFLPIPQAAILSTVTLDLSTPDASSYHLVWYASFHMSYILLSLLYLLAFGRP